MGGTPGEVWGRMHNSKNGFQLMVQLQEAVDLDESRISKLEVNKFC